MNKFSKTKAGDKERSQVEHYGAGPAQVREKTPGSSAVPAHVVPDRLAIDPHKEFYNEAFIKGVNRIDVFFDGKKRRNDVREYCISEGWIKKHIVQTNGKIRMERGKPVTVTMYGVVGVKVC